MNKKTASKKQSKPVPENERLDAAKEIVDRAFGGGTVAHVARVFAIIPEDAEREDLVDITEELSGLKLVMDPFTGLTTDDVLKAHELLLDADAEGAEEMADAIAETAALVEEKFGEEAAKQPANILAMLEARL